MKHFFISLVVMSFFSCYIATSEAIGTSKITIYGEMDSIVDLFNKKNMNQYSFSVISKGPLIDLLLSETSPDFFIVLTYNNPGLKHLKNMNVLGRFEVSEVLSQDIEEMPLVVRRTLQDNIMVDNDHIIGYPAEINLSCMGFWVPDAWNSSPFHDMEPPSSFCGLLDFIEIYLDTPHDGFCLYYDIYDRKDYPAYLMLTTLLRCWVIQQRYSDQPLNFDDPVFIELAERTRKLANEISNTEPNRKAQKGRQLFTDSYFGYSTNGKDTFSWDNCIPWKLIDSQEPLVNVHLDLYCLCNGSTYTDIAPYFMEGIIEYRNTALDGFPRYLKYLYTHPQKIDVAGFNKRIDKISGKEWKCKYITDTFIDSIYRLHEHVVPCVVPDEVFPSDGERYNTLVKLLKSFPSNQSMTGKEFAQSLDAIIE